MVFSINVFALGRHRRRRVFSLVIASGRLSVCPSRTMLPLYLFKDFIYQPIIWQDDAQYHGADRYKMPMLGQNMRVSLNFEVFHDRLFDLVWGTTLPL